jgi:hypothetical protein
MMTLKKIKYVYFATVAVILAASCCVCGQSVFAIEYCGDVSSSNSVSQLEAFLKELQTMSPMEAKNTLQKSTEYGSDKQMLEEAFSLAKEKGYHTAMIVLANQMEILEKKVDLLWELTQVDPIDPKSVKRYSKFGKKIAKRLEDMIELSREPIASTGSSTTNSFPEQSGKVTKEAQEIVEDFLGAFLKSKDMDVTKIFPVSGKDFQKNDQSLAQILAQLAKSPSD